MAEPNQKKNKGHHVPVLTLVDEGSTLSPKVESSPTNNSPDTGLTFWTLHPTEPMFVDLNEFSSGRTKADLPPNSRSVWAGDFSGRPELIAELQPILEQEWLFNAPLTVRQALAALRAWWRVLDEAERTPEDFEGVEIARVTGVEHLNDLHYVMSKRLSISANNHGQFLRPVNLRREQLDLPPLYWPSPDSNRQDSDAPTNWEMEAIRHRLKHGWFAVLDRWAFADRNVPDLDAWKHQSPDTRRETGHAVYRAVVTASCNPLPSMSDVATAIGYPSETIYWLYPLGEFQSGLYPDGMDLRYAFHICLLYSGWNVQTLLDLDIDGRFIEEHPTNPEYHLVYGFKDRGESEHFCLGRSKRSDSIGTMLRTIVARTKPLRRLLRKELIRVKKALRKDQNNLKLIERRIDLSLSMKSPWLFADPMGRGVRRLTQANVNVGFQTTFLRRVIQEINEKQPSDRKIRESITPSDFRDAYIGFAYEFSNYSILAAKVAATHRYAGTTQRYLRHKAWRAHSAKKVREFSTEVWQEIEVHRHIEPSILRAKMDFGGVSESERQRLKDYKRSRTRIGVGCRDFKNPPPSIAPEHVDGSGCRVQRCNLCRTHRILYDDSYDHIARRQAELEDIQEHMSVPAWSQSTFPDELEWAEDDLKLFDPDLVQGRLTFWREEVRSGRHRPITMEGEYK